MYQMEGETPKRPQPQASKMYETPKPQATDSIAPTEFPKLRSATGGIRLLHRSLHRYIRPSGGEDSRQVNAQARILDRADRKSTRLNSSHANISYAVFCLKKKK